MRQPFLFLIIVTAVIVAGCSSSIWRPSSGEPDQSTWLGKKVYWLSVSGSGKEAGDEAEALATEYCRDQDKEFKLILNRFRNESELLGSGKVICELYFDCLGKAQTATASRKRKKPKQAAAPAALPASPADPEAAPEPESEPEPSEPVVSRKALPAPEEPPRAPETTVATGVRKSQKIKLVGPRSESAKGPFTEGALGEPESLGFDEAELGKAKAPFTPPGAIVEEMITE